MSALPFGPLDRAPLTGEIVAFSGRLASVKRKEAHAIVARLGGRVARGITAETTMVVAGGAGGGEVQPGEAGPGVRRVLSEDEFRALAGLAPPPAGSDQQCYRVRDVLLMYPAVQDEHLRTLQKCHLLRVTGGSGPERAVSFADLLLIRQVHSEVQRGVSFRAVLRSLLASREGQLGFDFRMDAQPAKVIALRSAPVPFAPRDRSESAAAPSFTPLSEEDTGLAERYFILASNLDDGSIINQERAAAAYRKALEIDSRLVPALINLANIHYVRDELIEAQALYERAVRLEPDVFEAHYNLGNIHHDLGRYDEAESCYGQALELRPGYADAHLYLAVALEKAGRSDAARPHWRAYQNLEPDGEWAELAREFSE